jgi:hypothetical protein
MARTTLAIDDALLRELRTRAAKEGRTLQDVVNESLRRGLRAPARRTYALKLHTTSGGVRPGVDLCDRDRLFDLLDGPEP